MTINVRGEEFFEGSPRRKRFLPQWRWLAYHRTAVWPIGWNVFGAPVMWKAQRSDWWRWWAISSVEATTRGEALTALDEWQEEKAAR